MKNKIDHVSVAFDHKIGMHHGVIVIFRGFSREGMRAELFVLDTPRKLHRALGFLEAYALSQPMRNMTNVPPKR